MWGTTDPDGRCVILDFRGWQHIVDVHPELAVTREEVLRVVEQPDERVPGREPGEEWFYRAGLGPSRWVKVVVHYGEGRGRIASAFPRRSFP